MDKQWLRTSPPDPKEVASNRPFRSGQLLIKSFDLACQNETKNSNKQRLQIGVEDVDDKSPMHHPITRETMQTVNEVEVTSP